MKHTENTALAKSLQRKLKINWGLTAEVKSSTVHSHAFPPFGTTQTRTYARSSIRRWHEFSRAFVDTRKSGCNLWWKATKKVWTVPYGLCEIYRLWLGDTERADNVWSAGSWSVKAEKILWREFSACSWVMREIAEIHGYRSLTSVWMHFMRKGCSKWVIYMSGNLGLY